MYVTIIYLNCMYYYFFYKFSLHPKNWMNLSPEIVTTITEMKTTVFTPVITEYSKLLTSLRLIKTSYSELSKNSLLIIIGTETFATCLMLWHLDEVVL